MHADFHELSEVAAGRREARDHLQSCPACRAELARLRRVREALATLPEFAAPPGAWAGAQRRAVTAGDEWWTRSARLAMAASLLLVVAAAFLASGRTDRAGLQATAAPPQAGVQLQGLVAENARLESMLAQLPRTRATRVSTAYTVTTLEDRLAQVDDRITTVTLEPHAPEVAEDLWRERVALMSSLVQVQYANAVTAR